jgi:hypothetical protein
VSSDRVKHCQPTDDGELAAPDFDERFKVDAASRLNLPTAGPLRDRATMTWLRVSFASSSNSTTA